MKNIKEALECVGKIDERYNQTGIIKQFTIDMIEHFIEELNSFILGERDLPGETILGSLSYKASTALEICNDDLVDFYVMQELYDAINDQQSKNK